MIFVGLRVYLYVCGRILFCCVFGDDFFVNLMFGLFKIGNV